MTTAKSARQKGLYAYPKKIAKILGHWYYDDPKSLEPTRASGVAGKSNPAHSGDLGMNLEFAKQTYDRAYHLPWIYTIELKHDKSWKHKDWYRTNSEGALQSFWRQCLADANLNQLYPILIFTKNHERNDYIVWPKITKGIHPYAAVIETRLCGIAVRVTTLDNFVDTYGADDLFHLAKKYIKFKYKKDI